MLIFKQIYKFLLIKEQPITNYFQKLITKNNLKNNIRMIKLYYTKKYRKENFDLN